MSCAGETHKNLKSKPNWSDSISMIEPADQTTSSACFFKSALNQSALPLRQQPINVVRQGCLANNFYHVPIFIWVAHRWQQVRLIRTHRWQGWEILNPTNCVCALHVLISQYVKHISVTMLFSIICDKHFSFIHTEYLRESLCQFSLIFSKFHDFFVKLCVKLKKGKAN